MPILTVNYRSSFQAGLNINCILLHINDTNEGPFKRFKIYGRDGVLLHGNRIDCSADIFVSAEFESCTYIQNEYRPVEFL